MRCKWVSLRMELTSQAANAPSESKSASADEEYVALVLMVASMFVSGSNLKMRWVRVRQKVWVLHFTSTHTLRICVCMCDVYVLCVCMIVCVCMYVCVCTVYMCVCMIVCVCMYVCVCTVYMCVCMIVCVCMYVCVCTVYMCDVYALYVCMIVRVCTYVCVCTVYMCVCNACMASKLYIFHRGRRYAATKPQTHGRPATHSSPATHGRSPNHGSPATHSSPATHGRSPNHASPATHGNTATHGRSPNRGSPATHGNTATHGSTASNRENWTSECRVHTRGGGVETIFVSREKRAKEVHQVGGVLCWTALRRCVCSKRRFEEYMMEIKAKEAENVRNTFKALPVPASVVVPRLPYSV